jgi:hypothetical protein
MRRTLAVSISLAVLLLMRVWESVVQVRSLQCLYLSVTSPAPTLEVCALINTALFSALIFLCIWSFVNRHERSRSRLHYVVPAVLGWFILWYAGLFMVSTFATPAIKKLWPSVPYQDAVGGAVLVVYCFLLPAGLFLFLLRSPRRSWEVAQGVALVCLPFSMLCIGQTAWQVVARPSLSAGSKRPSPAAANYPTKPLVLWLMFDEMAQSPVFEGSLGDLNLRNLSALREVSFHADLACPPSEDTTTAIPSYLTGRVVERIGWTTPDDLLLQFAGSSAPVSWKSQRTVFHDAREAGRNTAVLGYFHPYCRLFGDLAAYCEVFSDPEGGLLMEKWSAIQGEPLGKALLLQVDDALPIPPLGRRFDGASFKLSRLAVQRFQERRHLQALTLMRGALLEVLAQPALDFVFIHLPLPHPPDLPHFVGAGGIRIAEPGYAGNLRAADYLVGEVRQLLTSSGRWDATTIVLTSDHGVRGLWTDNMLLSPSLLRTIETGRAQTVPFLVKLPYQTKPLRRARACSAVFAHWVVRAILRGELTRPDEISAYIDGNLDRYTCPSAVGSSKSDAE